MWMNVSLQSTTTDCITTINKPQQKRAHILWDRHTAPKLLCLHHDVIKWKHFPRYWPFVRGIHQSPVNSPHKGQWRVTLMFSLICAWINRWISNGEASDLRYHRAHYDFTVILGGQEFCHTGSQLWFTVHRTPFTADGHQRSGASHTQCVLHRLHPGIGFQLCFIIGERIIMYNVRIWPQWSWIRLFVQFIKAIHDPEQ